MIGLFDSGVGGLSVLKELRRVAPDADILYFGDIAHAPYGPKSTEELVVLTLQAMTRLHERGVTQFVAACNSISVSVIQPIVSMFGGTPGHIIEMVGPTAGQVAKMDHGNVMVIATEATVRSGLYERTFRSLSIPVSMLAVPELAFAIEQGASREDFESILRPVVASCRDQNIDTLVLGCTHYPLVGDVITQCVQAGTGRAINVFDPAAAVAREAVRQFDTSGSGETTFLLSKDSLVFRSYVEQFISDQDFRLEIIE